MPYTKGVSCLRFGINPSIVPQISLRLILSCASRERSLAASVPVVVRKGSRSHHPDDGDPWHWQIEGEEAFREPAEDVRSRDAKTTHKLLFISLFVLMLSIVVNFGMTW